MTPPATTTTATKATETVAERLGDALEQALGYNVNDLVKPVALLWPDEARQWEQAIDELSAHHRIIRFGDFDETCHQGPAYWLRCVIAGTLDVGGLPEGPPIVYLPGVARDTLRALETAPADLAPIGAIQHRCQWFIQPNGKDWTIRSFLSNNSQGLGLNVANNAATTEALVAAVPKLMGETLGGLEGVQINEAFLHGLINPDFTKMLLDWIDDPVGTRDRMDDAQWGAFAAQCKKDYGFSPESDGEIHAARKLGEAKGKWKGAWRRFWEAPAGYPGIPDRLDQACPDEMLPEPLGAWPKKNLEGEDKLRQHLVDLPSLSPNGARKEIAAAEVDHAARRNTVWARLGQAPLALALEHLTRLAQLTTQAPPTGTVEAIAAWYTETGWQADHAALQVLAEVDQPSDLAAVSAALSVVYAPWLADTAMALQAAIGPAANAGTYAASPAPKPAAGDVVMFVDGLRLDVAHRLADWLNGANHTVELTTSFAALPTVTATAKPVVVPIDQTLLAAGAGLDARRAPDGPVADVNVLRGLMAKADLQILKVTGETGDPNGIAWCEAGEIDHRGHDRGVHLAHDLDELVQTIASRVHELLDAGWNSVHVVADHGWLLVPGGLPKCDALPPANTEVKKGRCARLKAGADVSVPTVPWHWDPNIQIAVAPGIMCFEANQPYEHGGISPQECVVPRLIVHAGTASADQVAVAEMKWRGLTLIVEFTGLPEDALVDLRSAPGDASTSIAESGQRTGGDGRALLYVDDDHEGDEAVLVIVGPDGTLLTQRTTTVGQNR